MPYILKILNLYIVVNIFFYPSKFFLTKAFYCFKSIRVGGLMVSPVKGLIPMFWAGGRLYCARLRSFHSFLQFPPPLLPYIKF